MDNITNQMTASTPSSFGMPACGHAFVTVISGGVTRDRRAIVKGDMGLAVAYIPGTSAWRPPTS